MWMGKYPFKIPVRTSVHPKLAVLVGRQQPRAVDVAEVGRVDGPVVIEALQELGLSQLAVVGVGQSTHVPEFDRIVGRSCREQPRFPRTELYVCHLQKTKMTSAPSAKKKRLQMKTITRELLGQC